MNRIFFTILSILALVSIATWYFFSGKTYTFSFTQQQIEEQLASRFPIQKNHLVIFGIQYENPRVKLIDGKSEFAIGVDARAQFAVNKKRLTGSADLLTEVTYDPETGTFTLHKPRLTDLMISDVPQDHLETIKRIANELASEKVSGIPIYELRPKDVKTSIARLVLKSVFVRNGKLHVEIGI